jgi:hypothetical protein
MRFDLRKAGVIFAVGAILFCCSCEMHHLGEDPGVQRERVDLVTGSKEDSDIVKEVPASPMPSAKPTPAEFFPESNPR